MKTIKVSEATNIQLDWLVWKCAGGINAYPSTGSGKTFLKLHQGNSPKYLHPSTDWAHGGPIIEREKIKLDPRQGQWEATIWNEPHTQNPAYGPVLIAAMRCYVVSKLGETVEVPEELT